MLSPRRAVFLVAVVVGARLLLGCGIGFNDPEPGAGGGDAIGGTGGNSGGSAGSGGSEPDTCDGDGRLATKRIVRLPLDQLNNSLRAILGDEVADAMASELGLGRAEFRTFPALLAEGSLFNEILFTKTDRMAAAAGQSVLDNYQGVTGCVDDDEDCATRFLLRVAEQTYRRPLLAEEVDRLLQVYAEARATGAAVAEAASSGVYAAFSAPQYLYRSELGNDATLAGVLTQYEAASQLSYFLTGAPPDEALLAAAATGELSRPAPVLAQADRVLARPETHRYLSEVMSAYFGVPDVYAVVIVDPAFNGEVARSMVHESEMFLDRTLWNGSLADLITSRETFVNEPLAALYGVAPGSPLDEDGFAPVTLPEHRAGLLTQLAILTARSRPHGPSVVSRGFMVGDFFTCTERLAVPGNLGSALDTISVNQEGLTERERAELRFEEPVCGSCHTLTDPYGLVLDRYDTIGRYRTEDPEGRPIDSTIALPEPVGGRVVTTAAEMGQAIFDSGAFTRCLAGKLLGDATNLSIPANDCSVEAIGARLDADATFTDLVREVAASSALTSRGAGL